MKKREISAAVLQEGERRNATFGFSRHRIARIHAFIARQRRKERKRAGARRHRRHPCGRSS